MSISSFSSVDPHVRSVNVYQLQMLERLRLTTLSLHLLQPIAEHVAITGRREETGPSRSLIHFRSRLMSDKLENVDHYSF